MIYDVKTKNISFLRVSKMLRDKGVKNNKFLLSLYDESLVGVDPYSPNLTSDQKLAIYRECCRNKWYFLREVVLIPTEGPDVHYDANLGNITLSYLKSKNKNIILILPRQHGKTLGEIIDDVWSLHFVSRNTNVIYLNKDLGNSVKNLKTFRRIRDLLPQWMKDLVLDDKNDKDNEEYKLIYKRNNSLAVVAPGSNEDSADKQGRGLTVSNIVFDELA